MGKKKRHKIEVTSFAPEVEDGHGKTLHVRINGKPYTYETWWSHNSSGSELYAEDGDPAKEPHADCCEDRLDELSQIAEDAYWATMMNLGYAGMIVQAEMDAVAACKHPKKWAAIAATTDAKIAQKEPAPPPAGASAGFLAC